MLYPLNLLRGLVFGVFLSVLYVESAHAQFACGGPGPGYHIIYIQPASNGLAPLPICEYDDQPAQPQQPTQYWQNSYMAVAAHENASMPWVATGYLSTKDAENAAMAACSSAMGSGCEVTWTDGYNISIAVTQDRDGGIQMTSGSDSREAKKKLRERCSTGQNACGAIDTYDSKPWLVPNGSAASSRGKVHMPDGDNHARFASMAWVLDDKRNNNVNVWVSSGQASAKEAEAAVLAYCATSSGSKTCKIARTIADTYLTIALDTKGLLHAGSHPTRSDAKEQALNRCKASNAICDVVFVFDAKEKGNFVQDINAKSKK